MYNSALTKVVEEGGNIVVEGGVLTGEGYESGCYVKPAIAEAKNNFAIVQHETFAPILYLMKYSTLEEAKISYKYLALKHHPDKGGNQALFNIITKAYETVYQRLEAIKPKEKIEHNLPYFSSQNKVM